MTWDGWWFREWRWKLRRELVSYPVCKVRRSFDKALLKQTLTKPVYLIKACLLVYFTWTLLNFFTKRSSQTVRRQEKLQDDDNQNENLLWKSTEEPSSKIWWAVFSVFFISFYQLSLRLSSISLFAKQFLTRKLFKARSNSPILLFKNPFIILFLQCQWIYRKSKIPSAICCCGCWGKSRIIELNECVGYLWHKKLNT